VTIEELSDAVAAFNHSRGWGRNHTPAALAAALSVEASELVASFLWLTQEEQIARLEHVGTRESIEDEVADVAIYLLTFATRCEIRLDEAVQRKLAKNASRFPPA
jgi:dCTP diphosphatase